MNFRTAALSCIVLLAGVLVIGQLTGYGRAGTVTREAPVAESQNRTFLTKAQMEQASRTNLLPSGTRSLLNVDHKLSHGQFVWDERGAPPGKLVIRVNLKLQMLSVFRGGHEIGTSVILYGAETHDTPLGTFPIRAKLRDHRSRTYNEAPMPFTLWLTEDGVAIHGSDVRRGRASHGCVGVPLQFAERLFEEATVGDQVQIVAA